MYCTWQFYPLLDFVSQINQKLGNNIACIEKSIHPGFRKVYRKQVFKNIGKKYVFLLLVNAAAGM